MEKIEKQDKIKRELSLADFCIDQATVVMAEKGNTEAANAASLISIAESLLAIGTMMYEKREGEKE